MRAGARISALFKAEKGGGGLVGRWAESGEFCAQKCTSSIYILHTEADAVQFQAQHENLQRRPRHWRHSRSRLPCN